MDGMIKGIAGCAAVGLFFVLATVAWFNGCEPATCAYRAVVGAVIGYVVLSILGRLALKVIVKEMIDQRVERMMQEHIGPES